MRDSLSITHSSYILSDRKGSFALFASLFLLIMSMAGYAGLYYLNKSQEETQQDLIEQIQTKEDDLRPKQLDQIFSFKKRIQTISTVLSSHQFVASTFGLIERDTHPRVSFSSFSFSPQQRTITLKGEGDDYSVIAKQIAFFEGDQQVERVEFGGLALKNNHVAFNLIIHIMPTLTATAQ